MGWGSFLGGVLGGAINSAGSWAVNEEMLKHQDYWNQVSVDMANTAHRREVEDLKAAGLNPVLSVNGSGASVPSFNLTSLGNVGEGLGSGIASASKLADLEAPRVESQIAVNSATAQNLEAQNELIKSQIKNTDAQTYKSVVETDWPGFMGSSARTFKSIYDDLAHQLKRTLGIQEFETPHDKIEALKYPDHPNSAKTIHVEAPRHRWWHHIPGFRDDISND